MATQALRTLLLRACAVLVAIAASGCAAIHRPPTTIPDLLKDADAARSSERTLRDTVVARLARRAIARPDHTVDVLLLSGGGQNGAYGVGFVRGKIFPRKRIGLLHCTMFHLLPKIFPHMHTGLLRCTMF